jgi:hypothetical protein
LGVPSSPAASSTAGPTAPFDGKPFKIRAVAQATATGASSFTVNIYWSSGKNTTDLTTLTSDVLVIGSGAQVLASKNGSVYLEAVLMWDSKSQQLAGFWNESAGFANIATTPAVIKTSSAVTATNPITTAITSATALQFYVTFTCSTAANVSQATLVEFSIEAI